MELDKRVCEMTRIGEVVGMRRRGTCPSSARMGLDHSKHTATVRFGPQEFELEMGGMSEDDADALLESGRVTIMVEGDG